jgi:hypothetical protein
MVIDGFRIFEQLILCIISFLIFVYFRKASNKLKTIKEFELDRLD